MPRSLKKQVSIFPNLHLTTSIFNSNSLQSHEKYSYDYSLLCIVLQVLKGVERGDQQGNVASRRKDDAQGKNVGTPRDQAELLNGKTKSGHQIYHIPPATANAHVSPH